MEEEEGDRRLRPNGEPATTHRLLGREGTDAEEATKHHTPDRAAAAAIAG